MDQPYQYEAIEGSRSMRLLCLEPGLRFSSLKFCLQIISLDDRPGFEAIFYCWGDTSVKIPVSCNGKRLEISQTLFCSLGKKMNQELFGLMLSVSIKTTWKKEHRRFV
jgi:hypothetical protein